jgi:hypothetical protein
MRAPLTSCQELLADRSGTRESPAIQRSFCSARPEKVRVERECVFRPEIWVALLKWQSLSLPHRLKHRLCVHKEVEK